MRTHGHRVAARRALGIATIGGFIVAGLFTGRAIAQQPHMRAALDHLRAARNELQRAEPDKGGHRVNALARVGEAIIEVEAGMAYAGR